MATIVTFQPPTVTAVTLRSLTDATTGAAIPLPDTTAFAGPLAVGGQAQFAIPVSAPSSRNVNWAAVGSTASGPLPNPIAGVVAGDLAVPAGRYCTLQDLYAVETPTNIATFSNNGGTQAACNVARVQSAINIAEAEIDRALQGSVQMPVGGPPVDPVLANYAATLAVAWLYQPQAAFDTTPNAVSDDARPINRYRGVFAGIKADLVNYRNGIKLFAGSTFVKDLSPSAIGVRPRGGFYGPWRGY